MGRAGSSTKRRPKGKRGWRKIDVDSLIHPAKAPLTAEQKQARLSKLRDAQLWSHDITPRGLLKLTKAQQRLHAKKKLAASGHRVDSIAATQRIESDLKEFKQQRHKKRYQRTLSKHSLEFTFGTKTIKKEVKLASHPDRIKASKKRQRDPHTKDAYQRQTLHHDRRTRARNPMQDLWGNPSSETSNADSSESCQQTQESPETQSFPDVSGGDLLLAARVRHGCLKIARQPKPNVAVDPYSTLLEAPSSGQSINPLRYEYYYHRWKALSLERSLLFKKVYQNERTRKWYKQMVNREPLNADQRLQTLQQDAEEMKRLYLEHKKAYEDSCGVSVDQDEGKVLQKKRKERKPNGRMWGLRHEYQERVTPTMKEEMLGHIDSAVDHPLSFMFHELQRQRKLEGAKRHRYVTRLGPRYHGTRFKVQSYIGKLHHNNVGTSVFEGVDDLEIIPK